jgi:hypothetical protein
VPYQLRKLRKILKSFGAWEDESRGRGSHTMFFRNIDGSVYSYPVPTHKPEINDCYVKGVRKKFKLTAKDGVSDAEFFGRA